MKSLLQNWKQILTRGFLAICKALRHNLLRVLQKTLIRKHSFSLLEVIVSLMVLGIASVPMMHDVLGRARTYKNMNEKILGSIHVEDIFFSELAWLATSEDVSFQLLEDGFRKVHPLGGAYHVITEFTVIEVPEDTNLKARFGQLSVSLEHKSKSEGENVEGKGLVSRAVSIAFEEKP